MDFIPYIWRATCGNSSTSEQQTQEHRASFNLNIFQAQPGECQEQAVTLVLRFEAQVLFQAIYRKTLKCNSPPEGMGGEYTEI